RLQLELCCISSSAKPASELDFPSSRKNTLIDRNFALTRWFDQRIRVFQAVRAAAGFAFLDVPRRWPAMGWLIPFCQRVLRSRRMSKVSISSSEIDDCLGHSNGANRFRCSKE